MRDHWFGAVMFSHLLLPAAPVLYALLLLSWRLMRRHLLNKHVRDLPRLQESRHTNQKIPGTAVICGGSIAGLLAARVCHDHFERVLIVEAEGWVASDEGRKIDGWDQKLHRSRVVQYTSLHACQCYLFAGLQNLFPGFEKECRRSDIAVLPANPQFNLSGRLLRIPFSAFKSGLPKTMYLSRSGFETLLRRLVLDREAYPNVQFITGTVTDVRPDPANPARLCTVIIRTDSSGVSEVDATLIVDCSGPARAGMKWLERNGYGYARTYTTGKLPLNTLKLSFDQKLRYSSLFFRISREFHDRLPLPAELKHGKPIYTFLEDTPNRAFFVLMRPDGDQLVAFAGHHGTSRPQPHNLAELKIYVRELYVVHPIPTWVFEILDMLEEVQDSAVVSVLKVAPTSYIRYHQATNLPSNWIALGDSVMTVNPLFGEGCTKAFKGAFALHNVLRAAVATSGATLPTGFSTKFFAELYDKTDITWQNTRLMDYGVSTTEPLPGENLSSGAYLRWYITLLQRLAVEDDDAGWVMYNLAMGLASPIDAFYPNLVVKILWRAIFGQ
ncbi:hypothetical protein B0H11DRAFT_1349448 [Mycena galericulata]|nr:hypothetical protein B0H11DRAFT_1349448 [Mycena galericulata]